MKKRAWIFVLSAMVILFSSGLAEAANGTLKYAFKYKEPGTGIEQTLSRSWAYLRSTSKPPPMEKFFSKADYILWGSYGSYSQVSVPEGTYYLRITQRKNKSGSGYQYGPPEEGDYTWVRTIPIMITANQTLDLGTIYAQPFALSPITITGTVKSQKGVPLAGRYVRAQTEPCIDDYDFNGNKCGPVKDLALQPTDADGKYVLQLKDPGTYYIYTSPCITAAHDLYTGNRCGQTPAPAPVTVTRGDTATVNMVVYVY